MKYLLMLIALCLGLSGCALFEAPSAQPVVRDEVFVQVELVDELPSDHQSKTYGHTTCANGVCKIQLLKEHYPLCLTHEVRHLFEGHFHPRQQPSMESC